MRTFLIFVGLLLLPCAYAKDKPTKPLGGVKTPIAKTEVADFALGCFWAAQAEFSELKGVTKVVAGYSGGHVQHPAYDEVGTGKTGHAESVEVEFDPHVITFKDLVEVFFSVHNPTTLNRQGNDEGPQYRSILFYRNAEQKRVAEIARKQFQAKFKDPIVTEIVPFKTFWSAEGYHQYYYSAHPNEPYCKFVVSKEIDRFRTTFKNKLK